MLIRHYIDGIRVLLQRPTPSVEPRRHQLLTELISKWRSDNPGVAPPYYTLNAQATNQAWHEARGDIIDLADAIAKITGESVTFRYTTCTT